MNKRIVMLAGALALALVWVGFSYVQSMRPVSPDMSAGASGVTSSQTGAKTPVADFALKDENGQTHRLTDYKGQIVALVFYASW